VFDVHGIVDGLLEVFGASLFVLTRLLVLSRKERTNQGELYWVNTSQRKSQAAGLSKEGSVALKLILFWII
jgi:hypothetical protein